MSKLQLLPESTLPEFDAGKAMTLPLGAASPLWFAYAGVAAAGAAYWWMTRWTQPSNLEAMGFWTGKAADAVAETAVETLEVAEAVVEQAAETVTEAVVEAAPEPVAEAVVETLAAAIPEPVADPEPLMGVAAEPTPIVPDDLTRIVGIGPKLSASLAERGVTSFAQVAAWQAAELEAFDKAMDLKGRAVRDAWVAQAKRFSEG